MGTSFSAADAPNVLIDRVECCDWSECPSCRGTGIWEYWDSEGSFNCSSSNAMRLLAALGVDWDYGGTIRLSQHEALHARMAKLRPDMVPESRYFPQVTALLNVAARHQCDIYWG